MTPLLDVFSLSCSDVLDTTKVEEVREQQETNSAVILTLSTL